MDTEKKNLIYVRHLFQNRFFTQGLMKFLLHCVLSGHKEAKYYKVKKIQYSMFQYSNLLTFSAILLCIVTSYLVTAAKCLTQQLDCSMEHLVTLNVLKCTFR